MVLPDSFDLKFTGFSTAAFEVLARLRKNPRVDQYRKEKELVRRHIMVPFKTFRDDLVVNVVIPNHLELETERNVFSRLLKNDFGAGGSHSHVWMSFYRAGRTRLSDFQPFHGIESNGFYSGLHVGGRDGAIIASARESLRREPERLLETLNQILSEPGWTFSVRRGSGSRKEGFESDVVLDRLPELVDGASAISIYRSFRAEEVVEWGQRLVPESAAAMAAIWPLYEAFTG